VCKYVSTSTSWWSCRPARWCHRSRSSVGAMPTLVCGADHSPVARSHSCALQVLRSHLHAQGREYCQDQTKGYCAHVWGYFLVRRITRCGAIPITSAKQNIAYFATTKLTS
jgi:hypothetical protein